jgi:hypothetical protein
MGSAADTRRTADARDRRRPINRGEIHDQEAEATFPGLEDIPAKPCRWDRVHRSVRGAYYLLQAALRPGHSSSRPQATREHQRDEQSDHRVDRRSGDWRVSVGRSAASPDSRPRRRIRSGIHPSHSCDGDPRSPYRTMLAVGRTATLSGSSDRSVANLFDHLIVFGEAHLRGVLKAYASYYNEVRTHLSLHKDARDFRRAQRFGRIVAIPILGGIHHQYVRV